MLPLISLLVQLNQWARIVQVNGLVVPIGVKDSHQVSDNDKGSSLIVVLAVSAVQTGIVQVAGPHNDIPALAWVNGKLHGIVKGISCPYCAATP